MIDQFVEGLNKIRKPLLTGYCALFVVWLYWGTDLTTKKIDPPCTVPVKVCPDTEGRFGLDLEQACRVTELWEWAPTSARVAAVSFVAVMLGGLLDTILSAVWAGAASRWFKQTWVNLDVTGDDISFGRHAAFRFLLAGLATYVASPWVLAGFLGVAGAMALTAQVKLKSAPSIRELRLHGQPVAVEVIKLKLIEIAEDGASLRQVSSEIPYEFDKGRIARFKASDVVHNYPDALASAIGDLKSKYHEYGAAPSRSKEAAVYFLIKAEFDGFAPILAPPVEEVRGEPGAEDQGSRTRGSWRGLWRHKNV